MYTKHTNFSHRWPSCAPSGFLRQTSSPPGKDARLTGVMWSDGASAGSLLSWSRLTRYSRYTQLVPQSCWGQHTLKAWKESGMSRDNLTQGDMRTRKIRAYVVIRTMDSSSLDCLQGKGELVLFLVRNLDKQVSRPVEVGERHTNHVTCLVQMDKESDTCQRMCA